MSPASADPSSVSGRRDLDVAILAALIYEVRPFLRLVKAKRRRALALPVWEFAAGRGRGVAALAGVGEAAARRAAARLLTLGRPRVFLCIGFAGALTPEIQPGAIVLGGSYRHYSPKSGALRQVSPPPISRPCAELAGALADAGLPARCGSLVTAPAILAKDGHLETFQSLEYPVFDRETSAAAEVAAAHGVAFLGVRAVTDAAGEEIPGFIAEAMNAGHTPGFRLALSWLAHDPRRLVHLAHFWRRSRLAARHLAQALKVLLPFVMK
jgi:adenosylhomocysteine nucleosidase